MAVTVVQGGPALRRDVILSRAAALFAERGYGSTSLIDLGQAAGIAKATLFHYFGSKQQILYELYAQAMDLALTRIQASEAEGGDAGEKVRRMVREHVLLILENRELFKVLFDEEDELSDSQLGVIRKQQAAYIQFIATQLERLREEGRLREGLPPTIVVQGLIGMASWVYKWYDPRRGSDMAAIADVLADLALHGVIAPREKTVSAARKGR